MVTLSITTVTEKFNNPSFEFATDWVAGPSSFYSARSNTTARTGSWSWRLRGAGVTSGWVEQSFTDYTINANSKVSLWIKCSTPDVYVGMQVYWKTGSDYGVLLDWHCTTGDWTYFEYTWNPAAYGQILIKIRFWYTTYGIFGMMYLDDVTCGESVTVNYFDNDYIIDTSFPESSTISIPNWINQLPEINTNVWSKKTLKATYVMRVTDAEKWALDQLLISAITYTLTDIIYGIDSEYWIYSISSTWEGHNDYILPWKIEINLIKV